MPDKSSACRQPSPPWGKMIQSLLDLLLALTLAETQLSVAMPCAVVLGQS